MVSNLGRIGRTELPERPSRIAPDEAAVARAARNVLARCHYMIHGVSDGVVPMCAERPVGSAVGQEPERTGRS